MFPVHLLPPKGKSPRPWEGHEGRAHLVPFTHDEVAPAHHEAAGAHVHVAPWLQQSDVFLWERRNGIQVSVHLRSAGTQDQQVLGGPFGYCAQTNPASPARGLVFPAPNSFGCTDHETLEWFGLEGIP